MIDLGDRAENAIIDFKWHTSDGSGGSITRATDGTVWVYKANATGTEVQTGVTDTEDFDGLTGVHHCRIDLSDAFYATGNDYQVVLKAATIDGQTVNAVLATFSIQNRYMRGTNSAALASALSTHDGKLDTADALIDAIKVVTDNLAASAGVLITGAAEAGTLSTTAMTTDLTEATDDHYKGRVIIWTSGVLLGQATVITEYTGSNGMLEFVAVTEAPGIGDTFVIV